MDEPHVLPRWRQQLVRDPSTCALCVDSGQGDRVQREPAHGDAAARLSRMAADGGFPVPRESSQRHPPPKLPTVDEPHDICCAHECPHRTIAAGVRRVGAAPKHPLVRKSIDRDVADGLQRLDGTAGIRCAHQSAYRDVAGEFPGMESLRSALPVSQSIVRLAASGVQHLVNAPRVYCQREQFHWDAAIRVRGVVEAVVLLRLLQRVGWNAATSVWIRIVASPSAAIPVAQRPHRDDPSSKLRR